MKKYIFIPLVILVVISLIFLYYTFFTDFGSNKRLGNVLQGVGVLIALGTGLIALHISDKPKKKVKLEIEITYDGLYVNSLDEDIIPDNIKEKLKRYNQGYFLKHCRICFWVFNKSGFTLKNPNVTISVPQRCKYLVKNDEWRFQIGTNLMNSLSFDSASYRQFDSGNKIYLSAKNLIYLPDGFDIKVWVRLNPGDGPVPVDFSLDCDNAQGYTTEIEVDYNKLKNIHLEEDG